MKGVLMLILCPHFKWSQCLANQILKDCITRHHTCNLASTLGQRNKPLYEFNITPAVSDRRKLLKARMYNRHESSILSLVKTRNEVSQGSSVCQFTNIGAIHLMYVAVKQAHLNSYVPINCGHATWRIW
jgi:hypothetical protein